LTKAERELGKMGIAVGRWEAEPWKQTLREHGRAAQVVAEFLTHDFDDSTFPYDGNPFSVFEQNFVLACFCMRRLAEKLLLTDRLNERMFSFRCFPAVKENFRPPLPSSTSNMFYQNYRFDTPETASLTIRDFGNEVVHSSHVGVVTEPELLPVGIVVASDWRLSKRLLHLTFNEWADLCGTVLADRVVVASDQRDPETGQTKAFRLSRDEL
jgi:hypothetical protein